MSRLIQQLLKIGRARGWRNEARLPSRRDALKLGLLGATALLTPVFVSCQDRNTARAQVPPGRKRVAIIGAGFAGLAAADALVDAGMEVNVFEAESRVGGRVLTDRKLLENDTVELGGEFVGTNHPTWIALAEKYKIELEEYPEFDGDEAFILGGEVLTGEKLEKLYEEIETIIAKFIEMAGPIDADRPWNSPDAAALDGQNILEWFNSNQMSEQARSMMIAELEADNGVTAGRMSLLGYLSMVKGGGLADYYESSETHRAHGGNDALATAIAKKLGDRVKLRTPIQTVERGESTVKLTAGDGATFEADVVIVATPPTAWDKIKFAPAFDASLKPQFGVNTKLLVRVNEPFWGDFSPDVTGDGLCQYGWFAGGTVKDPPENADKDAKPTISGPIVYTLFSGAEQAQKLREMPDAERTKAAVASVAPAFPNLGAAVNKDIFVDWPGMPRVRGSYSFPAPGEVTRLGPILIDGITEDGKAPLLFAGEHTNYAFAGYMEGALSSGVRAANAVMTRVGKAK